MARRACWENLYLICTAESYLMRPSIDHGSKLTEEREEIHSSDHEFRSIYSTSLHCGYSVLRKPQDSFGPSLKTRKGAEDAKNKYFKDEA